MSEVVGFLVVDHENGSMVARQPGGAVLRNQSRVAGARSFRNAFRVGRCISILRALVPAGFQVLMSIENGVVSDATLTWSERTEKRPKVHAGQHGEHCVVPSRSPQP